MTMRCTRQGKEKEPNSLEQEEAEVDKDIGKKTGKKENKCSAEVRLSLCYDGERRRCIED